MPLILAQTIPAFDDYAFHHTPHYRPRHHHRSLYSPRGRYIAAVEEARAAEAEYADYLRQQQLEAALAQRRRQELARRQMMVDLFYGESPDDDVYDVFHARAGPHRSCAPQCPCASQRSYAPQHPCASQRSQHPCSSQRPCASQRSCAFANQTSRNDHCQRGERSQPQHPLHRQQEVGLKRKQEARKDEEAVARFLTLLFSGGRAPEQSKKQDTPTEALPEQQTAQLEEAFKSFLTGSQLAASSPTRTPSGTQQEKVGSSTQEKKAAAPQATAAPVVRSLKEQLSDRLHFEHEDEVRDTIHAIIASLFHPQPAAQASSQKQDSSSPTSKAEASKGKGKSTIPVESPTAAPEREPTPRDIQSALDTIANIEASFHALEADFTMPRALDFAELDAKNANNAKASNANDDANAVPPSPTLTYTSTNAPIHNYTYALSQLLAQLDAVESLGNGALRARRKEVVGLIERELESVEGQVEMKGRMLRRASSGLGVAVETQRQDAKSAVVEPQATVDIQPYDVEPESATDTQTPVQPVDHQPADTQPAATGTLPADTQAADIQPADLQIANAQPANHHSADKQPVDTQPAADMDTPDVDVPARVKAIELSLDLLPTYEDVIVADTNSDTATVTADGVVTAPEPETESAGHKFTIPVLTETPSTPDRLDRLDGLSLPVPVPSGPESSTAAEPVLEPEAAGTFLLPVDSAPSSPATSAGAVDEDLVVVDSDRDVWSEMDDA